jgi:hypothetical protein
MLEYVKIERGNFYVNDKTFNFLKNLPTSEFRNFSDIGAVSIFYDYIIPDNTWLYCTQKQFDVYKHLRNCGYDHDKAIDTAKRVDYSQVTIDQPLRELNS